MTTPNEAPAPKPPLIVAEEPDPPPEEPALRAEPEVEDADADHRPPPWAKVPNWGRGRGFPPGVKILFVLLRTDLMRVQTGGEPVKMRDGSSRNCRQLILWELSLDDMDRARQRAGGDPVKYAQELAIQFIRAVDGEPVDWVNATGPLNPRRVWGELGPRYRDMLHRLYTVFHTMQEADVADFFVNSLEVRTALS